MLKRPARAAVPLGAALIGAVTLAFPAGAQSRHPIAEGGVNDRARPEYDPTGINVGNFVVSPQLTTTLSFDDNIYRTATAKRDDTYATINPGISLQSRSPRYPLTVKADATIRRYARTETENSTQYDFLGNAGAEILSGTRLTAGGGYARKIEPRGSAGDLFVGGTPITFDMLQANLGAVRDLGRIAIEAGGRYARYDYRTATIGGVRTAQAFRNYRQSDVFAKVAYGIGPGIAVYMLGNIGRSKYPIGQTDRSSRGYSLIGGVQFGITRLITGSAGIGYFHEDFADPIFNDISGLDYDVSLAWNPTERVSVSIKGARNLQRSPFVGSAGGILSNATVGVDYELLRKLILSSTVDFARERFSGIDRRDRRIDTQVKARYLLNRLIGVSAAILYRRQQSVGLGARDYRGFGTTIGVTIRR